MANHGAILFSYAFPTLILTLSFFLCKAIDENRTIHIVYLGSLPDNEVYSPTSHHLGLLQKVVDSNSAANFLTRSYKRSFSGFAANLTDRERERLANMKEVVSVFPSRILHPQTIRSWDFIGFNEKIRRNASVESDTIIGVIDSGIWPESESFKDDGFGPPPKKWKGTCEGGQNFTCNKKLIGARVYSSSSESARDEQGHGTHTASTAAGNTVKDVSFYGLAGGTARGGVPSARIAVYKVCGQDGCPSDAILAAFDDAIADGADIITVSLGSEEASLLQYDPIAIGAFHAMAKGVLTSNSAGNSGPDDSSVSSVAPWILTVAASSTDRRIIDKVVLRNGTTMVGASVNTFKLNGTNFPLIYGKDASSNCSEIEAGSCSDGCLDRGLVKGKVVLCDVTSGVDEAYVSGAVGFILRLDYDDVSEIVPFPTTALANKEHSLIKLYTNSTKDPRVKIQRSEEARDTAAPVVASFSSRGPNSILPEIIKPDISAPGVTILAAFSPIASVTESLQDTRRVKYSILSGTSMSCPHAAGAAAYVKAFHPDWSPAAIKSSLMTTASPMNVSDNSSAAGEFAYGSGHINPVKAIDPGLVYEASKEDYIKLLCSVLDQPDVRLISGDNSTCSTGSDKGSLQDHNYPSLAAVVTPNKSFSLKFNRKVKNVGLANSTYKATIFANSTQVDVKVVPQVLSFKSLNEEKAFDVTVAGKGLPDEVQSHVSASLVWSDGIHSVRSPILIHNKQ
ncbi:putative cucumisin [Rosa chinensis]|uniref:Putative cucumisin n=1 Tax=Rosa chinensis TaxID=74649 RepID=A0A2P6S9H4_ROSCH|nr:subtilisin-like protease SBT4.3 [Rosa chinensis]PRQ55334.1 putative cucumisin [Rosa chinensis]